MVAYSIVNNSLFLLVIEAENPTMEPPAVSMSSQVSPCFPDGASCSTVTWQNG